MSVILSKWRIIKEVLKLRILQHALEEQSRVPKPDFVCTFHPQRCIIRSWSTVREANGFPCDSPDRCLINCLAKLTVVRKWQCIIMWQKCSSP